MALPQAPDHEALAPAHIAADKDLVYIGAEAMVGHIAPSVPLHAERLGHIVLAAHETGGDKGQLAVVGELFAGGYHAGAAGVGVTLGLEIGDDRAGQVDEKRMASIRSLNDIAIARGESLAQMALKWVIRDGVVTSVLIGASRPAQILENLKVLNSAPFTEEELEKIDQCALSL